MSQNSLNSMMEKEEKGEEELFFEGKKEDLIKSVEKEAFPAYTLNDFYRLAQEGAKKLGLSLDFEDAEQRKRLVKIREETEMPYSHGPIASIFKILAVIVSLPVMFVFGQNPSRYLPGKIKIQEGLPVTMPLYEKNGELNKNGSIKLTGSLDCRVKKSDVSFSSGRNPTTYFNKVFIGGRELNFPKLKQDFEKEHGAGMDTAKVMSLFADLAMLGASNEKTLGRKILLKKIKKLHGEVLFPREDKKAALEKAQENIRQPPVAKAISLPSSVEMESMDTGLVMGKTRQEEVDGLRDIFDQVASQNKKQDNARTEASCRSENSDSQTQGMRM